MLQNVYFLAKIGADTAENEQHFAEILPKTGNYPAGPVPQAGAAACASNLAGLRAQRQELASKTSATMKTQLAAPN